MSTKKETVRISRRALEQLKAAAAYAVGEEMKMARQAVHVLRSRDERGRWIQQTGKSALALKGETAEEIQAIQGRSAIRSAGVGALLAFLANTEAVKNWQLAKDHWWLLPLAVLALGWWLKNRGYKDGPAILTFGGAMLVQAYQKQQQDEANKAKTMPSGAVSPNTASPDVGALHPMGTYAWLQDPHGRWLRLAMPAAVPAALPQYTQHFSALPAANLNNTAAPTQEDFEAAQALAAAAFAA
jgi:hypothetical protein